MLLDGLATPTNLSHSDLSDDDGASTLLDSKSSIRYIQEPLGGQYRPRVSLLSRVESPRAACLRKIGISLGALLIILVIVALTAYVLVRPKKVPGNLSYAVILSEDQHPRVRVFSFENRTDRFVFDKMILSYDASEGDRLQAFTKCVETAATSVPKEAHNRTTMKLYANITVLGLLGRKGETEIMKKSPFLKSSNLSFMLDDVRQDMMDLFSLQAALGTNLFGSKTSKLFILNQNHSALFYAESACNIRTDHCFSSPLGVVGVRKAYFRWKSSMGTMDVAEKSYWIKSCFDPSYEDDKTIIDADPDRKPTLEACAASIAAVMRGALKVFESLDTDDEKVYVKSIFFPEDGTRTSKVHRIGKSRIEGLDQKACRAKWEGLDYPFACNDLAFLLNILTLDFPGRKRTDLYSYTYDTDPHESWYLGAAIAEIHNLELKEE